MRSVSLDEFSTLFLSPWCQLGMPAVGPIGNLKLFAGRADASAFNNCREIWLIWERVRAAEQEQPRISLMQLKKPSNFSPKSTNGHSMLHLIQGIKDDE